MSDISSLSKSRESHLSHPISENQETQSQYVQNQHDAYEFFQKQLISALTAQIITLKKKD